MDKVKVKDLIQSIIKVVKNFFNNSINFEKKQKFYKNLNDPDKFIEAFKEDHSSLLHENKSLSELLERALTERITGASTFLPNVDKVALIRDALKNNADTILEWLKDSFDGDKNMIRYDVPDKGHTGTKDGYIGYGFKRDNQGFVEPRKTRTMFLLLNRDIENETFGFKIKTAFPDLRENFEHDSTIDPLKVLKETELYQKVGTTGKFFYEMRLGENILKKHDAVTKFDLKFIKNDKSENGKNKEYIVLKYDEDNGKEFIHGNISKDGIEVAKKDEYDSYIDWTLGKAEEEYIPLNNDEAIQKFKGYCPRLYELLDDIKGKLDTRLEMENIRNKNAEISTVNDKLGHANETMSDLEDKTRPNITFDSMKGDKAKKIKADMAKQNEGTRAEEEKQRNTKEKEHQAPEDSIPSKPSGGGGNGGGPDCL